MGSDLRLDNRASLCVLQHVCSPRGALVNDYTGPLNPHQAANILLLKVRESASTAKENIRDGLLEKTKDRTKSSF